MAGFWAGRGPLRGIVFDLDGVLADSEPLYLRTINAVLAEEGVGPLTPEENRQFIGAPPDGTWAALSARFGLSRPASSYQGRYDDLLRRVLERELALRPDAARLLEEVARRSLPRALASSGPRRWTDLKLRLLGLEGSFSAVVSGDEVERPKPAPDLYLRACALADLPPAQALAVEDSPTGLAAARAAGLCTVALRTPATAGMDLGAADLVIDSLDELNRALQTGRGVHAD